MLLINVVVKECLCCFRVHVRVGRDVQQNNAQDTAANSNLHFYSVLNLLLVKACLLKIEISTDYNGPSSKINHNIACNSYTLFYEQVLSLKNFISHC